MGSEATLLGLEADWVKGKVTKLCDLRQDIEPF